MRGLEVVYITSAHIPLSRTQKLQLAAWEARNVVSWVAKRKEKLRVNRSFARPYTL